MVLARSNLHNAREFVMGGCQGVTRVFWVVTVVAVSQLDFLKKV